MPYPNPGHVLQFPYYFHKKLQFPYCHKIAIAVPKSGACFAIAVPKFEKMPYGLIAIGALCENWPSSGRFQNTLRALSTPFSQPTAHRELATMASQSAEPVLTQSMPRISPQRTQREAREPPTRSEPTSDADWDGFSVPRAYSGLVGATWANVGRGMWEYIPQPPELPQAPCT